MASRGHTIQTLLTPLPTRSLPTIHRSTERVYSPDALHPSTIQCTSTYTTLTYIRYTRR